MYSNDLSSHSRQVQIRGARKQESLFQVNLNIAYMKAARPRLGKSSRHETISEHKRSCILHNKMSCATAHVDTEITYWLIVIVSEQVKENADTW